MYIKIVSQSGSNVEIHEGRSIGYQQAPQEYLGEDYMHWFITVDGVNLEPVITQHQVTTNEDGNTCSAINPLIRQSSIYIMNEQGQTIEKLS